VALKNPGAAGGFRPRLQHGKGVLHRVADTPCLLRGFFVAGLVLRCAAMALFLPYAQDAWFVPFARHFIDNPSIDPWTSFAAINPSGFPYGPVMFAWLLPFLQAGKFFEFLFAVNGAVFAVKAAIFVADIALFPALLWFFPKNKKDVLYWYWLSPIVLVANYWAGQLDIIPLGFLTFSLIFLRQNRFHKAGFALACAISAKYSMAISAPFFLIYIIKNKRLAPYRGAFLKCFLAGALLLCALPFLSKGYVVMALGTRELQRLLELNIRLGEIPLFLTPVLYGIFLYTAWRLPRMAFSLFVTMAGASLLLLIMSTITPPGWYLWITPFLLYHIINSSSSQRWLCVYFTLAVLGSQLMFSPAPGIVFPALTGVLKQAQAGSFFQALMPFWYSGCILLGVLLIIGMLREGILRNDLFKIGIRPVSIGIAGDSGSGKDTCARLMVNLLGESSTVQVSGDDYHRWDRYGTMWNSLTHLSPKANELLRFNADIISVLNRKPILCHIYNHITGRFGPPVHQRSGDFVLVTGLHALYMENLNRLYDVSVFLDMREDLRVFFKCRRDVLERGHSRERILESIEKRKKDTGLYIAPQKESAQLVFSLEPDEGCSLDDLSASARLRLGVVMRGALYHEKLARNLIMSTFFVVDSRQGANCEHILFISGNAPAYIIEDIARRMLPELDDIISVTPNWQGGVHGLIQLIIINHLMQNCRERR
jgi:uridine kinase